MKTLKLKSSILAGACALLAIFPNVSAMKNEKLKEITKPYLGVYQCKNAQLGTKDLLAEFSEITLELVDKNKFILHYGDKNGEKTNLSGKYSYDKEEKSITLQLDGAGQFQRTFPLREGQLIVSFPVGNKQLRLIFEQK